jgi:hypothetical protein
VQDFVGKQEGKRQLGRFRHRRENNVELDLRETGWGVVMRTGLRIETSLVMF